MTIDKLSHCKKNDLAKLGLIIITCLALINAIKFLKLASIFPYPNITTTVTIGSIILLLIILDYLNIKVIKSPIFILANTFGVFITLTSLYSLNTALTLSRSLQFIFISNSLIFLIYQIKDITRTFGLFSKL